LTVESSPTDEHVKSESLQKVVASNLQRVREQIGRACERAGRASSEVTLVAVTKYAQLEWVRALLETGTIELGESRPQQMAARAGELAASVHWHLIGHLQRNKVRMLLPLVTLIHSVDSVRLLEFIDRTAGELGLRPRVLIEVNLTSEEAKQGFAKEELLAGWEQIVAVKNVDVAGLMTMAAYSPDRETARPTFAALRTLRDELRLNSPAHVTLPELSMGMSGDFEVGIEEGATLIRVGSALWDGLE